MTGTQAIPTVSDKYFDQLETREPAAREQALLNLLPGLIQRAIEVAPSWAAHLKGHMPAAVTSRAAKATGIERPRGPPPVFTHAFRFINWTR